MTLQKWLKNSLRTDFTQKQVLVRIAVDLFLSNFGLLLGVMTTVGIGIFTWEITPQIFFQKMFIKVWLANIPTLTGCCLIAYAVNGLYDGTWNTPYMSRITAISRAVLTAFCFFLLCSYITTAFIPRTTMLSGWIYIFVLVLSVRLFWANFTRRYHLLSVSSGDLQRQKLIEEMLSIAKQDGWISPEELDMKASWPQFDEDEIRAAVTVLRSGKVNQWTGEEVDKFQQEFADFCGVRHAIALTNGSVALDLALYTLNIGLGDEVIVTPRSFVASAGCVALRGAKPVFAEVDPDSQNITPESIRKAITPQSRAIIAVHLAGWPCDMDPILQIAREYNLKVIEDCAQCCGAVYYSRLPGRDNDVKHGKPVKRDGVVLYPRLTGSMGDMAAFSFCQDKIVTTGGEGGMLLTDDDALWKKAWAFKDHGKSYDAITQQEHPPGFRWLHESFGTNGRMMEMQAAIGRRQLRKLPDWLSARRHNAAILTDCFARISGLRVTLPPKTVEHAYYKYYVFVRPEHLKTGWNRERILNALLAEGVPCFSGSCSEIYMEKAFDSNGFRPVERLPVARNLGETSLMFLVHPTLTQKDMENVALAVLKVMTEAGC